jgi:hypothetical protein
LRYFAVFRPADVVLFLEKTVKGLAIIESVLLLCSPAQKKALNKGK